MIFNRIYHLPSRSTLLYIDSTLINEFLNPSQEVEVFRRLSSSLNLRFASEAAQYPICAPTLPNPDTVPKPFSVKAKWSIMPVVLRKRKAAVEPAPAPLPKRKVSVAKAAAKVKEAPRTSPETSKANGSASAAATAGKPTKVAVDDVITLAGFGGEVETQDGEVTTLQKLVEKSENGVVLFTYPRASTPGCTSPFYTYWAYGTHADKL